MVQVFRIILCIKGCHVITLKPSFHSYSGPVSNYKPQYFFTSFSSQLSPLLSLHTVAYLVLNPFASVHHHLSVCLSFLLSQTFPLISRGTCTYTCSSDIKNVLSDDRSSDIDFSSVFRREMNDSRRRVTSRLYFLAWNNGSYDCLPHFSTGQRGQ